MGPERPYVLSEHAIDRFIERWRPDLVAQLADIRAQATAHLADVIASARHAGQNEDSIYWITDVLREPRELVMVSHVDSPSILRTVLPPHTTVHLVQRRPRRARRENRRRR